MPSGPRVWLCHSQAPWWLPAESLSGSWALSGSCPPEKWTLFPVCQWGVHCCPIPSLSWKDTASLSWWADGRFVLGAVIISQEWRLHRNSPWTSLQVTGLIKPADCWMGKTVSLQRLFSCPLLPHGATQSEEMQSALGWKPSFCYNLANCYGARGPSIDENLQPQEKRNLKEIEQFSEETAGIGTDLPLFTEQLRGASSHPVTSTDYPRSCQWSQRAHSQIATNYSEQRLVAREQKAPKSAGASKEAGPRRSQVSFGQSLGKSRTACAKAQKPRSVLLEKSWAHLPCWSTGRERAGSSQRQGREGGRSRPAVSFAWWLRGSGISPQEFIKGLS